MIWFAGQLYDRKDERQEADFDDAWAMLEENMHKLKSEETEPGKAVKLLKELAVDPDKNLREIAAYWAEDFADDFEAVLAVLPTLCADSDSFVSEAALTSSSGLSALLPPGQAAELERQKERAMYTAPREGSSGIVTPDTNRPGEPSTEQAASGADWVPPA